MSIDLMNQLAEELPESSKRFVDKSFAISRRILHLLDQAGISQRDLADRLGKAESEISKWLSGQHNLTLRTLTLVEAALGEEIITVGPAGDQGFAAADTEDSGRKTTVEFGLGSIINAYFRTGNLKGAVETERIAAHVRVAHKRTIHPKSLAF